MSDLCQAIGRLAAVAEAAITDEIIAATAFDDASTQPASSINSYIEDMRLKKVVQRIWM
jgi:hypothetical protein